ncbi:hypothetical protein PVNG_02381 [Plasmodium vivax North Korean]|uniref:rRNA adenine N(6)-methyltransferase n=1 Tax=Plasmodium vivax North Korean TaxID=1035514 RepID=A0A0J9W6N8_PLAVI|nr:hypothetical protein PVNG_02381 [Plasmodium vivax North Korean]
MKSIVFFTTLRSQYYSDKQQYHKRSMSVINSKYEIGSGKGIEFRNAVALRQREISKYNKKHGLRPMAPLENIFINTPIFLVVFRLMTITRPIKFAKLFGVFLKNVNIQKRIARFINESTFESIVEIGPGCGQITQYIDLSKKKYIGIEIDKTLSSILISKFPEADILNNDFLKLERDKFLYNESLLFGNIPYSISTSIFLKFLELDCFKESYFTVQKEFFNAISAKYDTRKYCSLSVLFQTFCSIKKLFSIGRLNFFPKPNVDSIFLFLRKNLEIDKKLLREYSLFIKKCFSMPRKTLINNFEEEKKYIKKAFLKNFLPENIRAHQLKPSQFFNLFLSFRKDYIYINWENSNIERKYSFLLFILIDEIDIDINFEEDIFSFSQYFSIISTTSIDKLNSFPNSL